MNKLSRKELRDVQLSLLDEMDEFCNNNNIKYMLAYGTLIGAVRHKGFIPWDDDVDVMMSRPNFDKFKSIYVDNEKFGFKTFDKDHTYSFNFGRLYDKSTINVISGENRQTYGVCIDVYPMDGAPDSEIDFQNQLYDLKKITRRRDFILKCISRCYRFKVPYIADKLYFLLASIMQKRDKVVLRYSYDDQEYCSCISSSGVFRHKKINIETTSKLLFEGKEYFVPKEYDSFLREYYGDYMILPPEDQRVPYHLGNYYWRSYDRTINK